MQLFKNVTFHFKSVKKNAKSNVSFCRNFAKRPWSYMKQLKASAACRATKHCFLMVPTVPTTSLRWFDLAVKVCL